MNKGVLSLLIMCAALQSPFALSQNSKASKKNTWHDTFVSAKGAFGLAGLLGAGYLLSNEQVYDAARKHPYRTIFGLLSASMIGSVGYSWLYSEPALIKESGSRPLELPKRGGATYRSLINAGMISGGAYRGDYAKIRRITLGQFEMVLDKFFVTMQNQLNDGKLWLDTAQHLPVLLNSTDASFIPYAKKLLLSPGDTCICKGDLHGDIHSLLTFLNTLCKRGFAEGAVPRLTDTHLIFHGDYVDRGLWGTEVLYTLMLLKLTNPDTVHLIRGNHEDVDLCARYGFRQEFFSKFADEDQKDVEQCYKKIAKLYSFLPVVLYLGSGTDGSADYLQCCHGGIEIGYNPQEFLQASEKFHWIREFKQATNCTHLPSMQVQTEYGSSRSLKEFCEDFVAISPLRPHSVGFLWSDFVVDPESLSRYTPGRGLAANKELTHAVLKAASSSTHKLCGIIRAHQHCPSLSDPMMNLLLCSQGCARLWDQSVQSSFTYTDGLVITLLLSPDSAYGMPRENYPGFTYDTSLEITLGKRITDWHVSIWNIPVS